MRGCLEKEREWACAGFYLSTTACGPETREGQGIFNLKLMFLLRTASLTSLPSKPAMLGEWFLHPFLGLLRAPLLSRQTHLLCSIVFISPTYLLAPRASR